MGLLYFSNLANRISPKSSSISDYFTLKTPAMVRGSNGKSAQGGEGLTLSDAGVWRLNDGGGGGCFSSPTFPGIFCTFWPNFFYSTSYLAETQMSQQTNNQKVSCNMSNLPPAPDRVVQEKGKKKKKEKSKKRWKKEEGKRGKRKIENNKIKRKRVKEVEKKKNRNIREKEKTKQKKTA